MVKDKSESTLFYFQSISSMSEQFGYGTRFYKTVSDDLKSILPDVKSFSPTNLKYMRYFYEMYPDAVICPQVEDELITDANRPQVGDDLQIIFRIPWGHNKIILDKCKGNSAKALFYIRTLSIKRCAAPLTNLECNKTKIDDFEYVRLHLAYLIQPNS